MEKEISRPRKIKITATYKGQVIEVEEYYEDIYGIDIAYGRLKNQVIDFIQDLALSIDYHAVKGAVERLEEIARLDWEAKHKGYLEDINKSLGSKKKPADLKIEADFLTRFNIKMVEDPAFKKKVYIYLNKNGALRKKIKSRLVSEAELKLLINEVENK